MTYEEGKALVKASGSLEGIDPLVVADLLAGARVLGNPDVDDLRVAACASYELGKLGVSRDGFLFLNGAF
jgi:hypothetical protein